MSGERGQQRLSIRCGVCCANYRGGVGPDRRSPLDGWPGYDFPDDPIRLERNPRNSGRGRVLRVRVRCLRCAHVWWTVQFDAIARASFRLGYSKPGEAENALG